MKSKLLALILLASAALFPTNLPADTITQTFTFDSSDFSNPVSAQTSYSHVFGGIVNMFNPALGSLDSIYLSYSFTFSSFIPSYSGSAGLSGGGAIVLDNSSIATAGNGTGGGTFPGGPLTLTLPLIGSGPAASPPNVVGNGTLAFGFFANMTTTANSSLVLNNGTLSLIYNYTAVPEPAQALLLAPLALAVVARYRRRKA